MNKIISKLLLFFVIYSSWTYASDIKLTSAKFAIGESVFLFMAKSNVPYGKSTVVGLNYIEISYDNGMSSIFAREIDIQYSAKPIKVADIVSFNSNGVHSAGVVKRINLVRIGNLSDQLYCEESTLKKIIFLAKEKADQLSSSLSAIEIIKSLFGLTTIRIEGSAEKKYPCEFTIMELDGIKSALERSIGRVNQAAIPAVTYGGVSIDKGNFINNYIRKAMSEIDEHINQLNKTT